MKNRIMISVYIVLIAIITNQFHSILLLMAAINLSYWCINHFFSIREERNLLKEKNQYFMDAFHNIRTPMALVGTPLKSACSGDCPESIKKELLLSIRNMNYLSEHLTGLMNLKKIFSHPGTMEIAEYELGAFLKSRIYLGGYATNKLIKLKVETDFSYGYVWLDQSKISPVIDRFIKNAVNCGESGKEILLSVSLNKDYWTIETAGCTIGKLMHYYRCKQHEFLKRKPKVESDFVKSILCNKLIRLCGGKIFVNQSSQIVSLQFPVKHPLHAVSVGNRVYIEDKQEEKIIDNLFMKTSLKRESNKPVVVLADSNDEFRLYLEARLSDGYRIKSFSNGAEALAYIKENHPDLVICDTVLDGMNGDELSSRLKTSGETSIIPIILYGSHIDMDNRFKREASLADTYLLAPFHPEDLKIEMSVLIKNSRLLRKSFLKKMFGEKFLVNTETDVIDKTNELFIKRVKDFILENIEDEKLTIVKIAKSMNMGRTTFFNSWKLLTGEAPKYFIHRIRMEKARELLESGKYSVFEIPDMIGMKSEKNFRKDYKEYFKKTPIESIRKS